MPDNFNPNIAHITASDGTIFQVLLPDGSDWDEAATQVTYAQYLQSKGLQE